MQLLKLIPALYSYIIKKLIMHMQANNQYDLSICLNCEKNICSQKISMPAFQQI